MKRGCHLFLFVLLIGLLFSPTIALSKGEDGEESKILIELHELKTPNDTGKTNAIRSAELINGSILKPGEIFSFNQTVGEISKCRGFTYGYFISINPNGNKKVYFDSGSGVWRTSTAIFQAISDVDFEIIERHIIYFPESYTMACNSAMVKQNSDLDLQFKNNKDYSIKIESSVDDNALVSIKIYKLVPPEKN
ncbi:MAG: VanW family protein [Candidatus Shapirobacteria bacterium]|nr:VanW family protein [Candidatus Shapirobacteria bacterium]